MAKSVLDILIKLSKQGNADKETITGLVKLKSSFMDAAAVAGTLVAAGYAVKKALDATVGTMVAYADQVRSVQQSTGMSAEESSKLIQVLDDMKVSYEELQKVIQKNGDLYDFSVDGLAKMSDEYRSLTTAQDKANFMQERFGKSWISFVETMETGGDKIRAAGEGISDKLILDQRAVDSAREYERQVDNLGDSFKGLAISAGTDLLPALIEITKAMNKNIEEYDKFKDANNDLAEFINYPLSTIGKWILGITESSGAVDSASTSYTAWARSLEGARTVITDTTGELALLSAANMEFMSVLGSVQSAEESYNSAAISLAEDRKKIEKDRADEIAKGWATDAEKVREYDAALAENSVKAEENAAAHELANKKIILGLLERKVTADGVLDDKELAWLLDLGLGWGVYSQTVVDETKRAIDEANRLTDAINGIPESRSFTLYMNSQNTMQDYNHVTRGSGRAAGGPVSKGTAYIVGEKGPEWFVPNESGTIIPNGGGASMGGVGGGTNNFVINYAPAMSFGDASEAEQKLFPLFLRMVQTAQANGQI